MTSLSTLARAASLALILTAPMLSQAAHAFDAFGGDEAVVLDAARSARQADPADSPLARATMQAKLSASPLASNTAGMATDAPLAGHDLVGQGGPQDELARAIHHPGSGTDW